MGGSWIDELEKKITKAAAYRRFGKYIAFTDLDSNFYNITHQDPYFIDTRARRFTNMGQIAYSRTVETRKPFLDNDLIEFLYGIPDSYRHKSKMFKKILLYNYPEYYKNIPWQKTGYPISKEIILHRKMILMIKKLLKNFLIIKSKSRFSDYAGWLRTPYMVKISKKILDPKTAIYSNYININFIEKYIEPHNNLKTDLINKWFNILRFVIYSTKEYILKLFRTSNKSFTPILYRVALQYSHDYSEKIARALTMEIWFQQVFNKKHRK